VIGACGGAVPGQGPTTFLIGGTIAIDAGSLASALDLADQEKVQHVLLTHGHWDHLRDLPLFLDNTFGRRSEPVTIWGLGSVLEALRAHVFNDHLWPDLGRFSPAAIELREVVPGQSFALLAEDCSLEVVPIPSYHGVPATGYLIRYLSSRGDRNEDRTKTTFPNPPSSASGALRAGLALTTDTGYAPAFFDALAQTADLAGLVIEVSFPDRLEELAKASYHLTPTLLARGLEVVLRQHPELRVWASHLKPRFEFEIREELAKSGLPVEVLSGGHEIDW